MLDFLYQTSNFTIFIILSSVAMAISIISVFFSKRYIFYRLKYRDNATIGSISSLIGVIYGVLGGLMALYLLNNNNQACDAVVREADNIANIYRSSQWLNGPQQGQIRLELENYINQVVQVEWPLMRQGKKIDLAGDFIIQRISKILKTYSIQNNSELLIMQNLLTEVNMLYHARHTRINLSFLQLTPQLWGVILIATILIIGINYAFRVNFYLHLFAISAFAIMAASMLFLLVTLDRPFQGEFIIEPDAFNVVLDLIHAGQSESAIKPLPVHT